MDFIMRVAQSLDYCPLRARPSRDFFKAVSIKFNTCELSFLLVVSTATNKTPITTTTTTYIEQSLIFYVIHLMTSAIASNEFDFGILSAILRYFLYFLCVFWNRLAIRCTSVSYLSLIKLWIIMMKSTKSKPCNLDWWHRFMPIRTTIKSSRIKRCSHGANAHVNEWRQKKRIEGERDKADEQIDRHQVFFLFFIASVWTAHLASFPAHHH